MRHVLVVMAMFILFSCSNERNIKKLLIIGKQQGNTDLIISSAYDQTDTTSSFSILESDSLKNYSTIALLDANLMGVTPRQQTGLQRYMEASGSLVVSHTPINTYQWPWLHALQSREETSGHYGGGSYAFLETLEESHAVLLIGENTWQANHITTEMAPDENRFIIKELNNDLYEPMEIEILPDNRVMIMERRGKIKLYNPATNSTKVIANFDVCIEGNYEDGLLGMALDPDFENNRNVFIYYSPPCENTNQLLSRFKMSIMDTLIMASEKVVMEVKVQRETCCHSGGEVMFDHEGYLWLSTGDNTSSKESDGYTPIDERPGRFPFDAQKSSGNTHDLRGKILKIKVHPDGSYTIPEGNLFPPDGSKGRPEIYVMGARNPFRFTVDPKTGYLYWGDVGPDAGKDSRYGSESYDEWNQARTPGYYGWPYFMGNNITFPDRNFTTDEVGEHFNPEHPINDSPNNTGSRELPPARPAMVYYPYGESKEFPMLGTGSRSAMGGPFYYAPNVKSEVAFPDYFTGKMFIFEWARSWVKVMSFDEDANLVKIEPFLDNYQFSKPIDVEFGPDGAMYVVDYGANYFSNNEDARLIKIEYRKENIPPTAVITTEENTGGAPFTAEFKAENSFDLDKNDVITYRWFIKGEKEPFSHDSVATYTFEKTGNHTVVLEATDKNGGKGRAQQLIRVGNSRPEVSIQVDGNKTFYFAKDQKLSYQVSVTDAEDGTTENESIPAASVNIQFNYMKQGLDMANIGPEMFEGASIQYVKGKNLIDGSDCKSCHDLTKKSIGPSYMAVAEKYKGRYDAVPLLAEKIIKGGNGVWGESMMAAHPQHSVTQTEEMVKYILSLMEDKKGLDLTGHVAFNQHESQEGFYVLSANYADKVNNEIGPLVGRDVLFFRSPKIEAEDYESGEKVMRMSPPNSEVEGFVVINNSGGWFAYNNIDLTGISKIEIRLRVMKSGQMKLTSGKDARAKELATLELEENKEWHTLEIPVSAGFQDQFIVNLASGAVSIDYIKFLE